MFLRIVAALLVLLLVGVVLARVSVMHIPPRLNPWATLSIDEAPNFLTRSKLKRASQDAQVCRTLLEQTAWVYSPIEDEVTQPGCGYTNAVRIEKMSADVGTAFAVSCREALSLALWERHVVQPAALRYFNEPVTKLEHFGSYSCRSVYGRPNARLSHHATADALDVAGFVVGERRRIRVITHWDSQEDEGHFLREVHDGACRFFDSVYGPDYNEAHRDHFHLDRGSFRTPGARCRTAQAR